MDNVKEVINALEEAVDWISPEKSMTVVDQWVVRDALALLKAHEPRVMTLEEYEAWIDTPFTERNPVFHEERTKRGTVTCWVNTVVCTLREYGKNDRCWTSRPTDVQRKETPWQG